MNAPSAIMLGTAASFAAVALFVSCEQAKAAPCAKHTASTSVTKGECMREVKRKQARARLAWPPNPTVHEIRTRVDKIGGRGTWERAWRIARCETGANPRHFPNGRYIGMMGMFRSTYAYGARKTGYPYPHVATPQQQIAVAVASWPITRGWSGWGCSSA
jgi:hypothetical protein